MIIFKQKEYTFQQIARESSGLLKIIIIHLLKLKSRVNADRDDKHHLHELTEFYTVIFGKIEQDKTIRTEKDIDKLLDLFFKTTFKQKDITKALIKDGFYKKEIPEKDMEEIIELFRKTIHTLNIEESIKLIKEQFIERTN